MDLCWPFCSRTASFYPRNYTLITPGFVDDFDLGLPFVASGNLCMQI